MATTREQATAALFAKLSAVASFSMKTRRLYSPEQFAAQALSGPVLGLVTHHEVYHRPSPTQPPRRTLTVSAFVYINVSNNVNGIPDAVLNPILDAIDAALLPDNFATGNCTLGGLVFAVLINGEVIRSPGDKTGEGVAVIPIDIVFP